MRIRLQLLLPLAVTLLVAVGFLLATLAVGSAVRSAVTGDAPAAAVRAVLLWGLLSVLATAVLAGVIARLIVGPLSRMRDAASRLAEPGGEPDRGTPIAEIQDLARGIARAGGELRERHGREVRERSALAGLVDAVSEGILQLDGAGRIVRINRAGRRLLGLPAGSEGQSVGSLVRNIELRRLLARAAGGRGFEAAEVALDERRILASTAPLPAGGAVATLVDLTDRRRLEEIRRDFVANASHELKTPLTSIRGYTETLLSGELAEGERRQFLETIVRNAERLQHIVDDLLDLSRLESGRWQADLDAVDLAAVAGACWEGFQDRAGAKGVTFELEPAGAELTATADRRALEQVFANLYDNALRYTAGKGRVRVRVLRREEPGGAPPASVGRRGQEPSSGGAWLVVEVTDTGSGIPRDALPRIFERFYRVDPARSRAEGGTGLGLSIVKHLIESMGGGVSAESELGKGTTIRLWLPPAP